MTFLIEYEIPPLRAIYHLTAENCESEDQARELVAKEHPYWIIRNMKITPKTARPKTRRTQA